MTGSPNDRWEHGTRGVITGETGLAHAGSIVNDQRSNFFVAHDSTLLFSVSKSQNQQKEFEEGNAPKW